MLKDTLLDPFSPCLFTGYRNPNNGDLPDVYHTIGHWFESEKFRGVNEALRGEILNAPTGKEATKISKRNSKSVLPSWNLLSARVMRTGLVMAAHQNPDLIERFKQLALLTQLDVEIGFNPGALIGGYPAKWYAGIQVETANAVVHKPQSLAIAGMHTLSYQDKKAVVDKHANPSVLTMMVVPIARNASLAGEEWAIAERAPLAYVYAPKGKLEADFLKTFASAANKYLVFEKKNGSTFDPLIAHAKSMGKTVTLSLV